MMYGKKIIALITALVLLVLLTMPVFSADLSSESTSSDSLNDAVIVDTVGEMDQINSASDYETVKIETTPSQERDRINGFIKGLSFDTDVRLSDTYDYVRRVNGASQIDKSQVQSSIIITEPKEAAVTEFFLRSKTTDVLSGLGAEANCDQIYPGNILAIANDNIVKGKYSNTRYKRSSGLITMDNGYEIEIDDMSTNNGANPEWDIEDEMYDHIPDAFHYYVFRIASATSKEQLAASLGVTSGEIDQMINTDQWDLIRKGKTQMTAVSVEQIVCSLTFSNDLTDPADLFSQETTYNDLQNLKDRSMLIRKVNYGRKYLLTSELTLGCSPNEERIDMTDALMRFFKGQNITDEGQINVLKNADINAKEIGVHDQVWSTVEFNGMPIKSLSDFTTYLSNHKQFRKDTDELCLVPVSYEAAILGGQMNPVELKIDAKEYHFFGKEAHLITDVNFKNNASGETISSWIDAFGLDLDAFNQEGVFREKQYDITDSCQSGIQIPAYQNLYGIHFKLECGKNHWYGEGGNVKIYTSSRIYNGWGVKIEDSDGDTLQTRQMNLSGAQLYLMQEILTGSDRNRVDSILDIPEDKLLMKNGNPLYAIAADYSGAGWGSAWSRLSYDDSCEKSGRNLDITNRYGINDPGDIPSEETPEEDPAPEWEEQSEPILEPERQPSAESGSTEKAVRNAPETGLYSNGSEIPLFTVIISLTALISLIFISQIEKESSNEIKK